MAPCRFDADRTLLRSGEGVVNQLRLSAICAMLMAMGKLSTKWANRVNRAAGLLYPPECLFCHVPMEISGCCPACLEDIRVYTDRVCSRCGRALTDDLVPGPCGRCLKSPPFQKETVSLFIYRGVVREAILSWKLGGDDAAIRWLVTASEQRLKELFRPEDLLLPVPMPLSRMRRSGQHHAADLARLLARTAGCRWDWRLLRRRGEQPRQSSLPKVARRRNLRKGFYLNDDYWQSLQLEKQENSRVWIVDDILTTGATLHFAAGALRSLKRPVYAFSLTRTPNQL